MEKTCNSCGNFNSHKCRNPFWGCVGYTPKKVTKDQMAMLPPIIAVDFDGTLAKDEYPNIGEANLELFEAIAEFKTQGWKIVLWTCRDGEQLFKAVHFCLQHGLTFDAVNENIAEVKHLFNNDTRKIYANLYIDDKARTPFYPCNMEYGVIERSLLWHLKRLFKLIS